MDTAGSGSDRFKNAISIRRFGLDSPTAIEHVLHAGREKITSGFPCPHYSRTALPSLRANYDSGPKVILKKRHPAGALGKHRTGGHVENTASAGAATGRPGASATLNSAAESAISKTFLIFILLKSWLQGRQTAFLSWFLWKLPGTGEYAWLDLPWLISELAGDRPWRREGRGFQPACHQREAGKWRF